METERAETEVLFVELGLDGWNQKENCGWENETCTGF
jgi:hypothetical protein